MNYLPLILSFFERGAFNRMARRDNSIRQKSTSSTPGGRARADDKNKP